MRAKELIASVILAVCCASSVSCKLRTPAATSKAATAATEKNAIALFNAPEEVDWTKVDLSGVKTASDSGIPEAECELGRRYWYGENGANKDFAEAVKLFRQSSLAGSARAGLYLGVCYQLGLGVEKNNQQALKFVTLAGDQDDAYAQYLAGLYYEVGDVVTKEWRDYYHLIWYWKAAKRWTERNVNYPSLCFSNALKNETNPLRHPSSDDVICLKAKPLTDANTRLAIRQQENLLRYAQQQENHAADLYQKGCKCLKVSNFTDAVRYFKASQDLGDADAKVAYYSLVVEGKESPQNVDKAFLELQKLSLEFNRHAASKLGYYYLEGVGVKQNDQQAIKFLRHAADLGDSSSIALLTYFYRYGLHGLSRDNSLAFKLFDQYVLINKPIDSKRIVCSTSKTAPSRPSNQNFELLRKEPAAGDTYEAFVVKLTKFNSMPLPTVQPGPKIWNEVAYTEVNAEANNGNTQAQCELGRRFWYGAQGAKKDLEKAAHLFRLSAEGGNVQGALSIGICYQLGLGVSKDLPQALKWLTKAADGGNGVSQYLVGLFNEYGLVNAVDLQKALVCFEKASAQGFIDAATSYGDVQLNLERIEHPYRPVGVPPCGTRFPWATISDPNSLLAVKDLKTLIGARKQQKDAAQKLAYEASSLEIKGNYKGAFAIYTKAVNLGSASAKSQLAFLYDNGFGVAKNEQKASQLFQEAASDGDEYALSVLGWRQLVGHPNLEEQLRGLELLEQAAKRDSESALIYLVNAYQNGPHGIQADKSQAFVTAHKFAEENFPIGQFLLGRMYENGTGCSENFQQALEMYRKSAEQSNKWGEQALGLMYWYGKGVPEDDRIALQWFEKSARHGCAEGQYQMGVMYEHGLAVNRDFATAMVWYRKAAAQGMASAIVKVKSNDQGLLHHLHKAEENGVDQAKAFAFVQQAAKSGDATSEYLLADFYENGIGCSIDLAQALVLYKAGSVQESALAENGLANLYFLGKGVPKDLRVALYWYQRAANHELPEAFYNLGNLYRKGESVPRNEQMAQMWFRMSAKRGCTEAVFPLKKIK